MQTFKLVVPQDIQEAIDICDDIDREISMDGSGDVDFSVELEEAHMLTQKIDAFFKVHPMVYNL